jgi:integral membrane protein (TIGR01906 family)
MQERRVQGFPGGIVLAWAVILFTVAAAVCGIAGNGGLLASEMLRNAPPEVTGLPEKEYEAVGRMTADYLSGRTDVFQHMFSDENGTIYQCFQPHEAEHMADCRKLIRLAEILRLVFGLLGMMIVIAGILMPKRRKGIARSVIIGLVSAGAVGTVLLIWGVIDFDGLFTAFHRIAFTNDGWLLDPRTDLLIRLMPTELFIRLAARILLWVMGAAIVMAIVARVTYRGAFRSNPT